MSAAPLRLTRSGPRLGLLHGFGRRFTCALGRGGIRADKREGDGATPAAALRITGGFFRADRIAPGRVPGWLRPIGPRDLWSDDPADPGYNRLVRAPHGFSHERMFRADPLYDLVLTTDWNAAPAVPGRGSAIFLHIRRAPGHATAGCLAFSRGDLLWIIGRIEPGARVILPGAQDQRR
ncbi:L,D-transpeptidase family protein [Pseudogemmobacter sonorensis]|uniref:L,D-transpeptidase family protein n=1 Tax=Pseudogemmobacter sonorensis TaxID=2989681 RepID=UPI0036C17542